MHFLKVLLLPRNPSLNAEDIGIFFDPPWQTNKVPSFDIRKGYD